jgi:hypothetical protein
LDAIQGGAQVYAGREAVAVEARLARAFFQMTNLNVKFVGFIVFSIGHGSACAISEKCDVSGRVERAVRTSIRKPRVLIVKFVPEYQRKPQTSTD